MKKSIIMLCLLAASGAVIAKDVYVDGYTKKDGTYVAPHHRSSPNNNQYDNYSAKGNSNPYTGQQGTVAPDNNPYDSNPYGSQPKPRKNSF